MALIDELRMDRTSMSAVEVSTPSDAREYWKSRTVEERLAALELTRSQPTGTTDPAW
jgi:hypothetical protein